MSIAIRRMTLADVDAIADIEAASFRTPWKREAFVSEAANPAARYLVAEEDGAVIGYAGAWLILDEGHITNIAVAPTHRGRGVGRKLTAALMAYLSNLGASYAALEVRRSNTVAQGMYVSLGFIKLGVRKRYYEDTGEDAFFMVCDHLPDPDPDFEEEDTIHET